MQNNILGTNIRRLRKSKGWTQFDLADKLKCTQGIITAYETGKKYPSHKRLVTIAKLFDVPFEQLIGEKPLEKTEPVKNPKLLKKFEELQKLPPADRRAVFKMIDALIEKRKNK